MKIYWIKGAEIKPGRAFVAGDFKHPSNWAECWGADDFERWGVTVEEVADPAPPEPPRKMVEKWAVMERLTDAQLEQALSLMTARQKEKWRMPGRPNVFADDPEVVGLVKAVGADPEKVLA